MQRRCRIVAPATARVLRLYRTILCCLLVVIAAGCERQQAELLLVRPHSPIDADIVRDIDDLLGEDAKVIVNLTETALPDESALDALVAGDADLALVPNNLPYRQGVSTVMPLYPTVLHIGYFGDLQFDSAAGLIRGSRVFAGPAGSASRMMFERYTSRNKIAEDEFTYVEDPREPWDVVATFAPIAADRLEQFPGIRLLSAGSPDDIGKGTGVDAATLMDPQLRPFVIPAGTYGAATPTPTLTVAVDMMLVARSDLEPSVIYDLVNELHRLLPALASLRPGLARRRTDFDSSNSTFVLHPGLIAYLNRNEPSVYERYSGIAEVAVTVIVALFSAIFAAMRIYRMRRKNRIDTYYKDVIAIRNSLDMSSSEEDRRAAALKIRTLQNTAFEMLVDEKLAADESFRIFVTLSNDVLRDLGSMRCNTHNTES